ncbi:MAG TPA: FtsX-like permease family protein [Acidobacteriaceae bacterium]|nr:FtsX-like permease family protein [Acidobacteriaceae bacterium]
MASRSLTWKRAATIALRDLRSAPGKFVFVVLSVAVGVAALVGVRGFSESFRSTMTREARSLLAGDLSARTNQQPTPLEQQRIASLHSKGIRTTWVTETVSMASVPPDPVPILVSLKAVDPAEYPYYGKAILEPQMPLQSALSADSVVVADEFLIRLNAHVGSTMRLGGHNFRIAARLVQEPDRITAGAGIGPRVLISRAALAATGLLAPGSRANEHMLVQLPLAMQVGSQLTAARQLIEDALPEAQVVDYREGNPALAEGLDRATSVLSLICLVAMVLGAIGVAMSMHAHLEQRMDVLAILKAVGAGSSDLLRIFLLQTMGLGLAGAVIGVLGGGAVMLALPRVFGNLLPLHATLQFPWRSALAGLATGLLTTLLFCLPPLLDVRKVRPIMVLRRTVEEAEQRGVSEWLHRWGQRKLQIAAAFVILLALAAIAAALSDSATVGVSFGLALITVLLVLLGLSAVFLRLLRWLLTAVRLHLPQALRQGLANLYRPGNQSAAVLAALGAGVMLILAVYLMQSQVLREIQQTASPKLPNIFLVDITTDEVPGLQKFFADLPGSSATGHASLDLLPVVNGRVLSINGTPLDQLKIEHFPRRMLESVSFSWADALPTGDKLQSGKWWRDPNAQQVAINEGTASRIHVTVGSSIRISINDREMLLTVVAIFKSDEQHIGARANFFLPSGLIKDAPAVWYGSVRVDSKQVSQIERSLFAQFPTVTAINIADVLDRIETVVHQITFVVRFLAGFSIFAGLMILASSIAGTRFRRTREAVVLKTLGATRGRIVRIFSVEFSVLGILAGTVGVVFANLLTRVLLIKLDAPWSLDLRASFVALLGTAVLAAATGWLASYRILGLRPLEVLREE